MSTNRRNFVVLGAMASVGGLSACAGPNTFVTQSLFENQRYVETVSSLLISSEKGRRRVQGGRFEIRRVLYMDALTAARHNPAIKTFYDRLLQAGKLPKVALMACMRKLLTTLNAMVRTNKPWDKSLHGA